MKVREVEIVKHDHVAGIVLKHIPFEGPGILIVLVSRQSLLVELSKYEHLVGYLEAAAEKFRARGPDGAFTCDHFKRCAATVREVYVAATATGEA